MTGSEIINSQDFYFYSDANYCDIFTCENGGTCKEFKNQFPPFKCDCQAPFVGQLCETGKKFEPKRKTKAGGRIYHHLCRMLFNKHLFFVVQTLPAGISGPSTNFTTAQNWQHIVIAIKVTIWWRTVRNPVGSVLVSK